MPRIIIDTHKELPPFPFLWWCKESIYRTLTNNNFDLNCYYSEIDLGEGRFEYTQGDKHNVPK
ncbi:MAG: hypothetical protein WC390_08580 [Sulfurimonas sp.]